MLSAAAEPRPRPAAVLPAPPTAADVRANGVAAPAAFHDAGAIDGAGAGADGDGVARVASAVPCCALALRLASTPAAATRAPCAVGAEAVDGGRSRGGDATGAASATASPASRLAPPPPNAGWRACRWGHAAGSALMAAATATSKLHPPSSDARHKGHSDGFQGRTRWPVQLLMQARQNVWPQCVRIGSCMMLRHTVHVRSSSASPPRPSPSPLSPPTESIPPTCWPRATASATLASSSNTASSVANLSKPHSASWPTCGGGALSGRGAAATCCPRAGVIAVANSHTGGGGGGSGGGGGCGCAASAAASHAGVGVYPGDVGAYSGQPGGLHAPGSASSRFSPLIGSANPPGS